MPTKPPRACRLPSCPHPAVSRGRCVQHAPADETHRRRFAQGATSYHTPRWQQARKRYLLEHPLCVSCQTEGRWTLANTVDHVTPHRGDATRFWDETNWAASCASCHSKKTARESWRRGWGRSKSLQTPRSPKPHQSSTHAGAANRFR